MTMDTLGFIGYAAAYWCMAVIFFSVIQKPLFGLYNRRSSSRPIKARDVAGIYRHGFVSDAVVASYLTAVPLITGALATLIPPHNPVIPLTVWNVAASVIVGLAVTADTALYRFWGFKLDGSVLMYLRSLKGAFASVSTGYILAALLAWAAVGAVFFVCVQWLTGLFASLTAGITVTVAGYIAVPLLLAAAVGALFAVIRGLGIRPRNPSEVYFSPNTFLNHWALNPIWNFIYSLSTRNEFKGRFRSMTDEECDDAIKAHFPTSGTPLKKLLRTDRPNILLVVWESFGGEFCGAIGGRPGVTPCVDRIASEGILFTNCNCGSFRTDRGLVCLLSGYPAQPTTSVIRHTRKLPGLPGLARTLRSEGYSTTAIHGGDLSIMHKSDYYLASGHDRLISQKDFPSTAAAGKWGVHDGEVFDFVYDDIMRLTAEGARWMTTVQTLSSHEPFAVPYSRLDNKIDNSMAYTDAEFGRLVDRLRQTPAWDNLLIICVADHGCNTLTGPLVHQNYAHIPLLMTGGAVKEPCRIDTLMNQTDIAATLLGQMGIDHSDFTFSRDILADTYTVPTSMHVFSNGFMVTDSRGATVYDTVSDTATEGADPAREHLGKAILQRVYEDLDKL